MEKPEMYSIMKVHLIDRLAELYKTDCVAVGKVCDEVLDRSGALLGEVRKRHMSCKCQGCGVQYKVDLLVSDEMWEKIKPAGKAEGAGLLCGSCIMQRIEGFGQYGALQVVEPNTASANTARDEIRAKIQSNNPCDYCFCHNHIDFQKKCFGCSGHSHFVGRELSAI